MWFPTASSYRNVYVMGGCVIHVLGGELADPPHLEGGGKLLPFTLAAVTSGVPQGTILGPTLFGIFISGLDYGIKGTRMEFVSDTKLSGAEDTLEGRDTLQEHLDRLKIKADKNLMKFNKDNCKVLHMEKHNPGEQHRLGIYLAREQIYGKGPVGPGGQEAQCE